MNMLRDLWKRITDAWNDWLGSPAPEKPKAAPKRKRPGKTAPAPERRSPERVTSKPEPEPTQNEEPDLPTTSVKTWVKLYERNAEKWELDQNKYVAALKQYGRKGAAEAIMTLNVAGWGEIVKSYSPRTMDVVFFDGTKLSLQGHPDTRKVLTDAIKKERARRMRGTKAPKGHGMDREGNPK